jgi:hypothetical protein
MSCRTLARAASLLLFVPLLAGAASELSASDQEAAFEAAGFTRRGQEWRSACDDPGTTSSGPGTIETVRDLNGDGRPEAVITESGTYCYGHAGTGFVLVTQQADGTWKSMYSATGMATFLATAGKGGWPDIEVGGPGFCFPVVRWDGRAYREHRHEYEGKPCRPGE